MSLASLEAEAKVLLAKAKADVADLVAEAEPALAAALNSLVAQLEKDITGVIAKEA